MFIIFTQIELQTPIISMKLNKKKKMALLLLKKKQLLLQLEMSQLAVERRFWVHPINEKRTSLGLHATLINDLRDDPDKFASYLRMTPASFDYILSLVKDDLTKLDTNMRDAIPVELKLMATLHHLAEGSSLAATALHYRVGRSSIAEFVDSTCIAIWKALQPIYLKPPCGPEEWKNIALG